MSDAKGSTHIVGVEFSDDMRFCRFMMSHRPDGKSVSAVDEAKQTVRVSRANEAQFTGDDIAMMLKQINDGMV